MSREMAPSKSDESHCCGPLSVTSERKPCMMRTSSQMRVCIMSTVVTSRSASHRCATACSQRACSTDVPSCATVAGVIAARSPTTNCSCDLETLTSTAEMTSCAFRRASASVAPALGASAALVCSERTEAAHLSWTTVLKCSMRGARLGSMTVVSAISMGSASVAVC